jgi:hypothetical protein
VHIDTDAGQCFESLNSSPSATEGPCQAILRAPAGADGSLDTKICSSFRDQFIRISAHGWGTAARSVIVRGKYTFGDPQ